MTLVASQHPKAPHAMFPLVGNDLHSSLIVHSLFSSSSYLPCCKPSRKGGLSLSFIHIIFILSMVLLYNGVLSKALVSLSGEWYSLICRLWGKTCHLLWICWRISFPNIINVSSQFRMACSSVAMYLGYRETSLDMRLCFLMTSLGLTSSALIYKDFFSSFSIIFFTS